MIQVRATLSEAGYTIGEFDTYDEAAEFARWLQREHVRLRDEFDARAASPCACGCGLRLPDTDHREQI